MPLTFWTDLTKKQETSSAGASQKNYNKLSNLNPLHESKEKSQRVFLHSALSELTHDTSRSNLEEYFQTSVIGTSTHPSVQSLPLKIRDCVIKLSQAQESESNLYEISSLVAEWLMDAPNEYQTFFAHYIQGIPSTSARILISALSDAEFSNSNKDLLTSVSLFLRASDKDLAQTAAIFLLTSGDALGRDSLFQILFTEELPHSQLIKGIIELLS